MIAFDIGRTLQYQGLVEDEVQSHHDLVRALTSEGALQIIPGDNVYASEVGRIVDSYNIGLGEAECIAISLKSGCGMASDDGKARRAATKELGRPRVIGSLGLLGDAVRSRVLSPEEAHAAYLAMKCGGGFLPPIEAMYFHRL